MLTEAVENERKVAKNDFLRASVPPIMVSDLGTEKAEVILQMLNSVLDQLKLIMKHSLRDWIDQGKIDVALLDATFAILQDASLPKRKKRRQKALAGTLQDHVIYVDYVNNLNKAGLA